MNYLSTNIKFLRQQNNMSQSDLANVIGKTRTLITAWEADEREITISDIIKLSTYFNISMDSLVNKDLRLIENNNVDYLELLLKNNKNILKDSDIAIIKTVIEERIKESKK